MFNQKEYSKKYQKEWRARKLAEIEILPKIQCKCGCGTLILAQDEKGKPREYAHHHARKRPAGKTMPPRVENAKEILCACGCGGSLKERNLSGNKHFYIEGHVPNKIYPSQGAPLHVRAKRMTKKAIQSRASRWARKLLVLQHYSGSQEPYCACCNETIVYFLALDHIGNWGGKHRKELNGKSPYAWVVHNGLPEGFQVLCHNCNMALGMYGFCPHKEPK